MKKYYSLYQNTETKQTDIYIYGDITSWPWSEEDISSYNLSKELQELTDVDNINVYINSYGGEVAEGLAIYSALKRHKAKVTTYVDGFACSIASVIFCAGDERVVTDTSLLMIHNAWTYAGGNANDLRKQADDLEKITQASINAYMSNINIDEGYLKELLDNETWLSSDQCIEMGFATNIVKEKSKQVASQNIRQSIVKLLQEKDNNHKVTLQGGVTVLSQTWIDKLTQNLSDNIAIKMEDSFSKQDTQKQKHKNKLKDMFNKGENNYEK